MYKQYFGLLDEPFRMTPDTRYLFQSQKHEEAISSLKYGIGERKGFIVITGEIGTGKTTLCRALLNQLDPLTKTAIILNPSLSRGELLHAILDDLGIELDPKVENPTHKMLLDRLNEYLIEQARANGTVAVIIDEAQNLDPDVLEFIRLLSNLETEQEKLIQLILVGQPELNEILKLPRLEQLRQRIAVRYHITPLDRQEIPKYIKHRLTVAGNEKCVDYTSDAIDAIAQYTGGTPRLINIICDKCMLAAFAMNTKVIDGRIARTAIEDHEGPEIAQTARRVPASVPSGAPAAYSAPGASPAWLKPVVALGAMAMLFAAVVIAPLAWKVGTKEEAAAPVAKPAAPIAQPAAPKVDTAAALGAVLKTWGVDPTAASIEAAGMTSIRIFTSLPTLARINLPAIIRTGPTELALVAASPTTYNLYDPSHPAGHADGKGQQVSRLSYDGMGPVEATIPLPIDYAFVSEIAALNDPRLPAMLEAGLHSLMPQQARRYQLRAAPFRADAERLIREAVIAFQAASELPIDGVVGKMTWCALVARANPQYPTLSR